MKSDNEWLPVTQLAKNEYRRQLIYQGATSLITMGILLGVSVAVDVKFDELENIFLNSIFITAVLFIWVFHHQEKSLKRSFKLNQGEILLKGERRVEIHEIRRYGKMEFVPTPKIITIFFSKSKDYAFILFVRRGPIAFFKLPLIVYFGRIQQAEKMFEFLNLRVRLKATRRNW